MFFYHKNMATIKCPFCDFAFKVDVPEEPKHIFLNCENCSKPLDIEYKGANAYSKFSVKINSKKCSEIGHDKDKLKEYLELFGFDKVNHQESKKNQEW